MGMLSVTRIPVTTTGAAGSATGTTFATIAGFIQAIRIEYVGTAPNTTTVDIDELDAAGAVVGLGRKLLDLAASNTDVTISPVVQSTDNTGTLVAAQYGRYVVPSTPVRVTVALSNALAPAVIVTIVTTYH